jgi:hypothetical protein
LLGSRVLDAAFDLEPVPIQVDDANAIADQSASPCMCGAAEVGGIVA